MKARVASAAVCGLLVLGPGGAMATMPRDGDGRGPVAKESRDQPNPVEVRRIAERQRLRQELRGLAAQPAPLAPKKAARAAELRRRIDQLAKTGTDRVLVILVEFAGTNAFTWTPGVSTWDPFGLGEQTEYDGTNYANAAASAFFAAKYGIVAPTNCRYDGPRHNQIPRPLSADDVSGELIWTHDFTPAYYSNVVFGNGWTFGYSRVDASRVEADFTGKSVRHYYRDLSANRYDIGGDVVGWVQVTNSVWYYGADQIPGRRSGATRAAHHGAIPGAGNARQLVIDALEAVKTAYPAFDWARYDMNGDTLIDRLWIIHAGYGEEDSTILLNRTTYGEGGLWSHASALTGKYQVVTGIYASAYIMMPENCGIGVLAHEYAHNLGADDLYAYGDGDTSAGFWTLMADDWTGFPIGFEPPALDPLHLDQWGWLEPYVISDPASVHEVRLGQASFFPGGSNLYRAAKIELPDYLASLAVAPRGAHCWHGGSGFNVNGSMVQSAPLAIPIAGADLIYAAAWDTEANYDYFRVLATADNGTNWSVLAASSGTSFSFPAWRTYTNSLAAFAGQSIQLAFQYYTDYAILGAGVFVDDVHVVSGAATLLQDDAETDPGLWTYYAPWSRSDGFTRHEQCYYLQWRNTATNGGYDSALGDARWRFGPANSGLLVWHYNSFFNDNEIADHLAAPPSFGPKGRLLAIDAHPEPYRDPYWLAQGFVGERANIYGRSQMRDAPFSLSTSVAFALKPPYVKIATNFAGRTPVPLFSDVFGYYPGLEQVRLPNGDSNRWMTAAWDASAVVPGAAAYGVKAAGYPAGADVCYVTQQSATTGTNRYMEFATNLVAGGTALSGSGNPGAQAAAYGWNVRILSQSATQALVRIWNGNPLEILTISPVVGSSSLSLSFSAPGRPLAIQASTNLSAAGGGFSNLISDYTDNHVTLPSTSFNRFYRLGVP